MFVFFLSLRLLAACGGGVCDYKFTDPYKSFTRASFLPPPQQPTSTFCGLWTTMCKSNNSPHQHSASLWKTLLARNCFYIKQYWKCQALILSLFSTISYLEIALNAAAAEFAPVSLHQEDVESFVALGELFHYQHVSSMGILRSE